MKEKKISNNYGSFTVKLTRVKLAALSGLRDSLKLTASVSSFVKWGSKYPAGRAASDFADETRQDDVKDMRR